MNSSLRDGTFKDESYIGCYSTTKNGQIYFKTEKNDVGLYCIRFGGDDRKDSTIPDKHCKMTKTAFKSACAKEYENLKIHQEKSARGRLPAKQNMMHLLLCASCKLGYAINEKNENFYPVNIEWIDILSVTSERQI